MSKTHCPKRHEYTPENTYVDGKGYRHCKTCRRDRMQARREGTQVGYANSRKTHCPKNHEYTEENTYRNPEGRRWCRTCMRANSALQGIKKYGILPATVFDLLNEQENHCAICLREFGETLRYNVDHDHACCPLAGSCGQCVRGLLCNDCNNVLGRADDDPTRLRQAAAYLESRTLVS